MTVDVQRCATPQELKALAQQCLMADEARHNVLLGIISTLEAAQQYSEGPPYLAVVRDDDAVIGAAVITPPHPLTLSLLTHDEAFAALAEDLQSSAYNPPGVFGPEPSASRFAVTWSAVRGCSYHRAVDEICYRLDSLSDVSAAPGRCRRASRDDAQLLSQWLLDFAREATPQVPTSYTEEARSLELRLSLPPDLRGMFVWENDGPVCMAGYGNPTPNSLRIGPVYTPPQHRGRGYAKACTAAACEFVFGLGKSFVTLYADAANPISNHVYVSLGFKSVGSACQYRFT